MINIVSLVLCGGLSKRLWPMSKPKQFNCIYNDHNLLENTINRSMLYTNQYQFVTNKLYVDDVINATLSTGVKEYKVYAEPQSRNTATAIFTALLHNTSAETLEDIIVMSPSDHLIQNQEAFEKNIQLAIECANEGFIALIGIQPNSPNTHYGYIEIDKQSSNKPYFVVTHFHEKPNAAKASEYFGSSHYLWNSGIYVFKRKTMLEELSKVDSELTAIYQSVVSSDVSEVNNVIYFSDSLYTSCPDVSIDKLITERSNKVQAVRAEFSWKDLGSWETLSDIQQLDQNNNYNDCNAELINVNNTFVSSTGSKKIVIEGVSDLIIIETEKGILIKPNNKINSSLSHLTPITTDLKQKMNEFIENDSKNANY